MHVMSPQVYTCACRLCAVFQLGNVSFCISDKTLVFLVLIQEVVGSEFKIKWAQEWSQHWKALAWFSCPTLKVSKQRLNVICRLNCKLSNFGVLVATVKWIFKLVAYQYICVLLHWSQRLYRIKFIDFSSSWSALTSRGSKAYSL